MCLFSHSHILVQIVYSSLFPFFKSWIACVSFFGGTGVWKLRVSHLQNRHLYHWSHISSPFCRILEMRPLTICLGLASNLNLSLSASQVVRITGVSLQRPATVFLQLGHKTALWIQDFIYHTLLHIRFTDTFPSLWLVWCLFFLMKSMYCFLSFMAHDLGVLCKNSAPNA
jgi:hypothetical protein